MTQSKSSMERALDLMLLCFAVPREQEIALALTNFLGARAGEQIVDLRPDMAMGEILDRARSDVWTTAEFCHMLELAGIKAFDEQCEQMTFREFVRYSAAAKSE